MAKVKKDGGMGGEEATEDHARDCSTGNGGQVSVRTAMRFFASGGLRVFQLPLAS